MAPQAILGPSGIEFLALCESGKDPKKNTGNGYYGAFQFSIVTWNSLNTGYTRADLAPYSVQVLAVKKLLSMYNIYDQFPGCAYQMRGLGII